MKTTKNPIIFTCPGCKETFEFDAVGAYELVPCPICGTDFMTVRKGRKLQLEAFAVNSTTLLQVQI
jgi:Zn finger protein HypA/HybF involved in hydrogenase expression